MSVCIIYQVKPEFIREYGFRRLAAIEKDFGDDGLPREAWAEVYRFEQAETGELIVFLESLYIRFNENRPADFTGHSLSVSDIVETPSGLFFCDSLGWKPVKWKEAQV